MNRNVWYAAAIIFLAMMMTPIHPLLAQGNNNEAIANSLVISPQTVKTHVQNIMQKLGVHSRVAAIAFAMREGVMEELIENVQVR